MKATELIKKLQGLVEAHGDSELMVGKEKLKADMGIGGIDNALVIWLHAGPFAQLAIRGLPQPQEPVKSCTCYAGGVNGHTHWCPVAEATLVCTCVEQPKDPCAAHGPKIF